MHRKTRRGRTSGSTERPGIKIPVGEPSAKRPEDGTARAYPFAKRRNDFAPLLGEAPFSNKEKHPEDGTRACIAFATQRTFSVLFIVIGTQPFPGSKACPLSDLDGKRAGSGFIFRSLPRRWGKRSSLFRGCSTDRLSRAATAPGSGTSPELSTRTSVPAPEPALSDKGLPAAPPP